MVFGLKYVAMGNNFYFWLAAEFARLLCVQCRIFYLSNSTISDWNAHLVALCRVRMD
jgi:hypothetical protein